MYYIKDEKFYIGYVWTNGYTTEVVDSHVFYECNLETVVLPASITSIGYAAFRGSLPGAVRAGGKVI